MTTNGPARPTVVQIATVAAVAGIAAIAIDLGIAAIGRSVFEVADDFQPYQSVPFVAGLGIILAAIAYWLISRRASDPRGTWTRAAVAALIVSALPDIGLLVSGAPGATPLAVASLLAMHGVTAAIVVVSFLRFAPPGTGSRDRQAG